LEALFVYSEGDEVDHRGEDREAVFESEGEGVCGRGRREEG